MVGIEVAGVLGLTILDIDMWAFIRTLESRVSRSNKVWWSLIIIFVPVLGLLLWCFLGPPSRKVERFSG
ncbi:MAG: PLDc N-terminal domain-containing protein [Gammaproteobacteria bacterium]|nr:PLDc N-terminal domain-containing protein [Gammaproteobacteria bacterium]